jgi:hypothetical protein
MSMPVQTLLRLPLLKLSLTGQMVGMLVGVTVGVGVGTGVEKSWALGMTCRAWQGPVHSSWQTAWP